MSPKSLLLRALVVATALVATAHGLQCTAKMKPVAIDTEDENGGVARTSFLYVEVESNTQITLSPQVCPDGTIPPLKVYEMEFVANSEYMSCPPDYSDTWGSQTSVCVMEDAPAEYDDFLASPAKYACMKVTTTSTNTGGGGSSTSAWTNTQCQIHENNWSDNICCPPDKTTLFYRRATEEENQNHNGDPSSNPMLTLGRCTAAIFTELYGNDVDPTTMPFDTSDMTTPSATLRMDGQDGRDGPFTIKDVYTKLGDRAKTVLRDSFWPQLMSVDTAVSVTGVTDYSESEIVAYLDALTFSDWDCGEIENPNPEDCVQTQATVASAGGASFGGFTAGDRDSCQIDFPGMDAGQLSNVLNQMMWGYNTDKSAMASALTFKYKSCNAALTYPSTLGIPPLARDNIAGYFASFHNDPVPGNNQIRSAMKRTGFKSAVSKNVSGACSLLVTLVDVPLMVDPEQLVSVDGVAFADLKSIYAYVPDAYVALDAFTVLARTTGIVPGPTAAFTVVTKNTATEALSTFTNITATSGAYSSLKKKLDARNDQRWDKNFACGGMDNDRVGGKINVPISQSPRSPD